MNYRESLKDAPLWGLMNCTLIWIAAVENEMESLFSA